MYIHILTYVKTVHVVWLSIVQAEHMLGGSDLGMINIDFLPGARAGTVLHTGKSVGVFGSSSVSAL